MDCPQDKQYIYVDTDSALKDLSNRMHKADRIAVDTEADSLHHYFEKVCLIQISFGGANYIIDPLSKMDLSGFLDILSEKAIIFHDGGYDLRIMLHSLDFRPKHEVFDTMLAVQLLGHERLGLASVVEHFFGTTMVKGGQRADWSKRPLRENLLEYASNDTRYLEELAVKLEAELAKADRTDWHRENCRRMVKAAMQDKKAVSNDAWRIKGCSFLDRRQLAFVRQIWRWRDHEAQRVDFPAFKIMPNPLILELAQWASSNPEGVLADGPKLPRNCTGGRLKGLERTIQKARNIPENAWPQQRKPKKWTKPSGDYKAIVSSLQKERLRLANKVGIPSGVLAPHAALEWIAYNRPKSAGEITSHKILMQWQCELLWPTVKRVLKEFP